jgi:hypothetical protein
MRPGELTVSGKVATQLDWTIDELKVGDNAKALERLCRLRGQDLPDIQTRAVRVPVVGTIGDAQPPAARIVTPMEAALRAARGAAIVTPLPKPRLRVVNPAAITAYKKNHRHCETSGPDCHGPLDFSHIRSKQNEGDDCEANGLIQCRLHHGIWEATKVGWWRAVGAARLTDEGKAKVLAHYPGLPDGDDQLVDRETINVAEGRSA